jgi:hypothetical protein
MKQYILEKPRGRTRIEIVCCDDEDWFYDVNRTDSKTGKLKHTGMIIQKEVQNWIDSYVKEGYKLISEKDI